MDLTLKLRSFRTSKQRGSPFFMDLALSLQPSPCLAAHTWTPPKPFGPKKRSHSAAMSAQRHSNRWTMEVLPCLVWGLCWAKASPNNATKMNNFMISMHTLEYLFAAPDFVFIYFILSPGPMGKRHLSAY